MPAARLSRKAAASNSPATPAAQPAAGPVNKVEQYHAAWHAVAKVAEKIGNRDELTSGNSHDVKLYLVAQVDGGEKLKAYYDGPLTIGGDSEVAPSHFPGGEALLLAVVLGKLNGQTREAVMRDILADYSRGELPEVEAGELEAVKSHCKQIRAMFKAPRKGSVSYAGKPAQPPLGFVE